MLSTEVLGLCNDEFFYWDNRIVQWWMIISFFHDSCYLHQFCDGNIIMAQQFSFACVVLFLLVATFCAFVTEHNSIVNDVFDPHNLLVVIFLSAPYCQWCIYSAQIHSWVAAMGPSVSVCYRSILFVLFLICFGLVLLVHQLTHLSLSYTTPAGQYNLEVSIYCALCTTFTFIFGG